jgi:regulator of replication initiation timing
MSIDQIETNLYDSFKRVKSDILKLNNDIAKLNQEINKISANQLKSHESVALLSQKVSDLSKTFTSCVLTSQKATQTAMNNKPNVIVKEVKVPSKQRSKTFIASITGEKFHIPQCIYTRNIKPKSKLTFKSKEAFLNKGYKPCECVKRV